MSRSIKTILEACFPEEHAWKMALLSSWKIVMGKLASTIFIENIKASQLTLSAPNSCWVAELHTRSQAIIGRVNAFLKAKHIKRLRCVVRGTIKKKQATSFYSSDTLPLEHRPLPPVPPRISQAVKSSFDNETQKALIQYWQRCAVRQKIKDN